MFKTLDKVITTIEETINGSLILAATIVLFINVMMRYFFHNASTWAEEAIRYAIIWVTFFGSSMCAKHGNHVGIDIFAQMMPPKGKKIILFLGQFLAAIFCACLTYAGVLITQMVIQTAQRSPAMLMPMWIVYICMPIGMAFTTVRFFWGAINILRADPATLGSNVETNEEGEVDLEKLN